MTTQRDFKRIVRARMQKTGESYTAARAQLMRRAPSPTLTLSIKPRLRAEAAPAAPAAAVVPVADYARVAGMSDEAVKKATGCTWKSWVGALDYVKAYEWPHRAIAEYLHEKYETPGWWTQMVAVGYERIRGLRERGQRRSGEYEAAKSRTFEVPVSRLFRAFKEPRMRSRWLPGVKLIIRTAKPDKTMRITWPDGTSVELYFTAKGTAKSSVAVQHVRIAGKAEAVRLKAYWEDRLDALAGTLTRKVAKSA